MFSEYFCLFVMANVDNLDHIRSYGYRLSNHLIRRTDREVVRVDVVTG
jgi:hypothetical protein